MISCLTLLSISTFLDCVLNPESEPSLANLLEKICFSAGSLAVAQQIAWVNWKRQSISQVIRLVNEKSLGILQNEVYSKSFRQRRNGVHLFLIGIFISLQIVGIFICMSFFIHFVLTGRGQFHIFFNSHRLLVYTQFILQIVLFFWITNMFNPAIYTLILEVYLRISLNYQLLAVCISSMGNWKENEENRNLQELRNIFKEFKELQSVIDEFNLVLRAYISPLMVLTINSTGLYLINIVKAETVVEAIFSLSLPLFLSLFLATFCILGQIVRDSVSIQVPS